MADLIDRQALRESLNSLPGMYTDELGLVISVEALVKAIDFAPGIGNDAKNKRLKDWTLEEVKAECEAHKRDCIGCHFADSAFCKERKEYPNEWNLDEKPRFTPEEIERAKAVKVLYPKADYIEYKGAFTYVMSDYVFLHSFFKSEVPFPTLKDGETVTLDEIIGEAVTNENTYSSL